MEPLVGYRVSVYCRALAKAGEIRSRAIKHFIA
jgi:hypothetical protein